ncbi:MAG: hypothetical protein Q3W96_10305, partial [Dysosmobacter sp.]|uniref:hypothetical protein n=1 Tax=Dysosmobacter sp. TaxID=2591382 RepID=UPI00284CA0C9
KVYHVPQISTTKNPAILTAPSKSLLQKSTKSAILTKNVGGGLFRRRISLLEIALEVVINA